MPEVTLLLQHLILLKQESERYRPERCPNCGKAGLWCHGHYDRKAVRQSTAGISNPVPIPRFLCPHCNKTCSALPECLAPQRWYLWSIQQAALLLSLAGQSLSQIAKQITPSRHTVSRWLARAKERFRLHKDVLCNHVPQLGRTSGFVDFWQSCCHNIALSRAMYFCHIAGVTIP